VNVCFRSVIMAISGRDCAVVGSGNATINSARSVLALS
jgi:hypothetical protein